MRSGEFEVCSIDREVPQLGIQICRFSLKLSGLRIPHSALRTFDGGTTLGDSGLEFFDMFVREPDGANQRAAFARAVAVGASGDQEMKMIRHLPVMLGGGSGMFGVE